jgi:integrase
VNKEHHQAHTSSDALDPIARAVHPAHITNAHDLVADAAAEAAIRSVPASTARAYAHQWNQFVAWAVATRRTPMPADSATLVEYTAYLCAHDRAPASIEVAIAAIRARHTAGGLRGQPETDAASRLLAQHRGDRSRRGIHPVRARVFTAPEVDLILETCDAATLAGPRDAVILILGIALMADGSTLANLDLGDLRFTDDSSLIVTVHRSRTDPYARGTDLFVAPGARPRADPVSLTHQWVDLLDEHGIVDGPLLRSCGRGGRLETAGRMAQGTITSILRRRAALAGIDGTDHVSAYSLRATGASLAACAGVRADVIARHGGWSLGSPIVQRHVDDATDWGENPMSDVGF